MDLSSLTINLTPLSLHMRCEDEFSGLVHCWQGWGLKHSGFDRALEEGDVEYRPNLGLRRELQPVVLRQLVLVMAVLVLELQLPRRCCLQGPTPCEEQARKALESALGGKKAELEQWDKEIKRREEAGGGGNSGGGGWFRWGRWFGGSDDGHFWQEAQQASLTILGILVVYLIVAKGDVMIAVIFNPLLFALRGTRTAFAFLTSKITNHLYQNGQLGTTQEEVAVHVSAKERVVGKWGSN